MMVDLELGQRLSDCSREWANATMAALPITGGVHPATIIAACGRMAGTYLFRSFDLKLKGVLPGDAVLSDEANQHSPMLIQIMANVLTTLKVSIENQPPGEPGNPNTRPTKEFLETQRILEPIFEPVREKYSFTLSQAGQAAAIATAILINHFIKHLDPNVAFGLAVYSIIEGCKTAPDPVIRPRSTA
jgi:hypothetical protein